MKHINFRFLSTIVLCLGINMNVMADVVVNGLRYSLSGTTAEITGYTEDMPENLVIPETITYKGSTYSVTAITGSDWDNYYHYYKYPAFEGCSKLKSLVVPASIGMVWGYSKIYVDPLRGAFLNCTNLEVVHFKGSTEIGYYAFSGCRNLRILQFDKRVSIGQYAFWDCSSLKYLVIPDGTSVEKSEYGVNAFRACNLIQNVIYLGRRVETGLSNVNEYFPNASDPSKRFLTWAEETYKYTGKSPFPNYTNNLPNGFQPTIKAGATLEKDAGTHTTNITFTFTNADMSFDVEIPYTYTIAPAELEARAENATRLYGDANPSFKVRYSGFVNGEGESEISTLPTCTTTATAKSNVGTYEINISGGSAKNYTFSYEGGQLTIGKAPLSLKAKDKSMVYGDKVPTLEMEFDGLKNNESKPQWVNEPRLNCTATSASKVGTYSISISQGEAVNYNLSYKSGTLTVAKAPLKLTANSKRITYGEGLPTLDYAMSGLKNGETKPEWKTAPKITTTATASSKAGNYPITIANGEATNYELSYESGQLTIGKAQLTVSTKNYTRAYGEANPNFELSYEGFVKNEKESVLFTKPKATTKADKTSDVGTYDITISGGVADNYDFKYVGGKLTIEKAYQTLTWNQELAA